MINMTFVTDPMCSWCWGMADEFKHAQQRLAGHVRFDLMLGGVNTHGSQPIGAYGRRFLMRLWEEVAQTTGQTFGFRLPPDYVHNSLPACLAIEVVREAVGTAPFHYLHALQQQFFEFGQDITNIELLGELAEPFGISQPVLEEKMSDPGMIQRLRFQFDNARSFGTSALPALLIEKDGATRLFGGGYMDAQTIVECLPDPQPLD